MNKLIICFIISTLTIANAQQDKFKCPNDKYGQYKHSTQCDKYYECIDGVSHEKLCPDGLVFDDTIRLKNKCDQIFTIDCEDRIELQQPKSNRLCPRQNGFFTHPDETVCNIYYNCINGDAIEVKCAVGLHFDDFTGTCAWPIVAKREGCIDEDKALKDGFTCPTESNKSLNKNGQTVAHPKFPHPTDCQKFYVCLNGVEPRELGCGAGLVYNEESQQCGDPKDTPGCEDWYKDDDVKPTNNRD